jgi:ParB family chromosome partitioning protein
MATQKRNALGRGLDALLSMDDVKTEGSSSISEIELAKITVNPNQPRREFDQTALQELADSIAEIGIIQPITLRKLSDASLPCFTKSRTENHPCLHPHCRRRKHDGNGAD